MGGWVGESTYLLSHGPSATGHHDLIRREQSLGQGGGTVLINPFCLLLWVCEKDSHLDLLFLAWVGLDEPRGSLGRWVDGWVNG